jgi:hypothetical protein
MSTATPKKDEVVDLAPQDWKSEREKPKEPFFGNGLIPWLVYLVGFAITYYTVRSFTS